MKKVISNIIMLFLFVSTSLIGQTYILDSKSSTVDWVGYGEIGSFKQSGKLTASKGQITYNEDYLVSGNIVFDMKTIDHEDRKLVNHLKDKDFFDVKNFPESEFTIKSVYQNAVSGILTMKGISIQETFIIETSETEDIIEIKGSFSIDRTKYGIKYNSNSYFQDLGNYAIKNEIDLDIKLIFKRN